MREPTMMTESVMRQICREACDGVRGARPDHPRLHKDVESAAFLASRSPTFRAYVAALGEILSETKSHA